MEKIICLADLLPEQTSVVGLDIRGLISHCYNGSPPLSSDVSETSITVNASSDRDKIAIRNFVTVPAFFNVSIKII